MATLTPEERATLQQQLQEARAARHKLLTGTKVVSVGYGERRIQYRDFATDIEKLEAYIRELEEKLGLIERRRPLEVQW